MTEKEREDLKKLSVDELVELAGTLKEANENLSKEASAERAKILADFLGGTPKGNKEREEETGEDDDDELAEIAKKLKNKFKGR